MKAPKFIDEYEIVARYMPAILAAMPLMLLTSMVKRTVWSTLFGNVEWLLVVENVSVALIVVVLLMQTQRAIAKYCFEGPLFSNGTQFPTTTMLLLTDSLLSRAMKDRVRIKARKEFGLTFLDAKAETADLAEARRTIQDAVGLIRQKVGKGRLTHRHNIQYGFLRNLIAGSVWALPASLMGVYLLAKQENIAGAAISGGMAALFFSLLLFHRPLLRALAQNYARVLFAEYLELQGDHI